MALVLGDNFSYQGSKPLDARLKYDTVANMKAVVDATMYDGCLAYCVATDKTYQWKSTNTVDETLGKWREFSSGGGGGTSDYSDLTNKPSINNVTLSGNKSLSDLGVPTKTSDLTNDSGFITSSDIPSIPDDLNDLSDVNVSSPSNGQVLQYNSTSGKWENKTGGGGGTTDYADLSNKPSIENVTLSGNKTASDLGLVKSSSLATVATSGSYNDLTNKPTIPDDLADLGEDSTHRVVTDAEKTTWNGKQDVIQVSSLYTPSEALLGKVYQYIGETGNGFTHNYFYECVSNGEPTPTYSWVAVNVQAGGSGGGGHTIENASGTDLTQRDTLQFGDGFSVTDDSTNLKTVVTVIQPTVLTQTLTAGSTSVTFTGIPTTGNYLIDFYTSNGINYTAINNVTAGQVTLTFESQSADVVVQCEIKGVL